MKKTLILFVAICLVLSGVVFVYFQSNGPKIVQDSVTLSKSVDGKGKPVDPVTSFTTKDKSIYVSAKFKTFFRKSATVKWYKEETTAENRIKVDDGIKISKAHYAYSKLELPEGLTAGKYAVSIYYADSDVSERTLYFEIK
ncbi:hypothetical protein [Cohnella lupini]|uniref:Ig-like domain-containing protein n=1 Tax=Cohnella lupini TaxID=1294267 RepID=A0A3D9IX40_9BACL|nr:hypothetical protein [Cohnella lupini]RED66378.1 hypothetical protein DFP95_101877 [Cohnella lupini]